MSETEAGLDRRTFIKGSAAVAAAASVAPALARPGWIGGSDRIRIGVIGCGGRGTGAAVNAMEAHAGTDIVALADLFDDRLQSSRSNLSKWGERAEVIDDRCYVGFDAYERLLADGDVDVVILATPPHFRPIHFEAAVKSGKHVFMEKPVAVDPAGVRRVIAAASAADVAGLSVVTGTQRRHEPCYVELMRRIGNGDIGRIVSARCYWNQGGLWVHKRKPEYTDMEWQCRNWLYFTWLSGDHICEQHIHNLDVMNWAIGATPLRCTGMGGREVRTGDEYGNIFDHFAIEYEYPEGVHVLSMCRQIDGCASKVEEVIHGSRGTSRSRPGFAVIESDEQWMFPRSENKNPYVLEHRHLYETIRSGGHVNEARRTAESTLTAIMGRMSAYTGKSVTWEQAINSDLDLAPSVYEFGPLAVAPVSVPGRTPLE